MTIEVKYKKDKRAISKEGYRTFQTYEKSARLSLENADLSKLEIDLIKENVKDGVLDLGFYGTDIEAGWLGKKITAILEGDDADEKN